MRLLLVVMLVALPVSTPSATARERNPVALASSTDDAVLTSHLAGLGPDVSGREARAVAATAYFTGRDLRREWRVVPLPLFQNFLVNTKIRKGGLCFQWARELLVRLDGLKLKTLELHWGESFAGTLREHNVVVVTAKGQPFEQGILLDNWRYSGRLAWARVSADSRYHWTENKVEFGRTLNRQSVARPGVKERSKRAAVAPDEKN
ncbi:hypothetical protein BH18VER1_BH18VER1_04740 [soil metagenome]